MGNRNLKTMAEVLPKVQNLTSTKDSLTDRPEKKAPLRRVYLAGPDLFHKNGVEIGIKKKAILKEYGLIPYYPGDTHFDIETEYEAVQDDKIKEKKELTIEQLDDKTEKVAMAIARGHEIFMRNNACCAIINCTPYRGPSMDAGTIYELGFMRALGKPCFGFTNAATNFNKRSRRFSGVTDETTEMDADGNRFEEFNTADNLMIDHGILGGIKPFKLVKPDFDISDMSDFGSEESLALFRKCVEQIVAWNKMYAE